MNSECELTVCFTVRMPKTEHSPDLTCLLKEKKICYATWLLEGYWFLEVETDMSSEIKPIGRKLDLKFVCIVRQRLREGQQCKNVRM